MVGLPMARSRQRASRLQRYIASSLAHCDSTKTLIVQNVFAACRCLLQKDGVAFPVTTIMVIGSPVTVTVTSTATSVVSSIFLLTVSYN